MTEPLAAVQADAETGTEGAEVLLVTTEGEGTILIPPPGSWKARANRALATGDFFGWADLVLSDDDATLFSELDPTNDDVEAFFKAWQDASGESKGKSRRSTRSSGSTRKR